MASIGTALDPRLPSWLLPSALALLAGVLLPTLVGFLRRDGDARLAAAKATPDPHDDEPARRWRDAEHALADALASGDLLGARSAFAKMRENK